MLKIKYPGCTAWTLVSVTTQKKHESPADICIITQPLPKSRSKFAIISLAGTRPQPPPRVTITIKDIVLNIKIIPDEVPSLLAALLSRNSRTKYSIYSDSIKWIG
ncbi:unnamed protein product [Rhizophagus irregularis]|nr:unnamed protein product [Rhizophagus irregularis]